MLQPKTAVPYSRCGEESYGSSHITVSIFAPSLEKLEERFEYAKSKRIIGGTVTEQSNGRWIRRWKEERMTLADVVAFRPWNRNPRKRAG
tara:strand:- start:1574 stop:1843 length:270 start_codon:yes stop_codon:yes gene_type:complete